MGDQAATKYIQISWTDWKEKKSFIPSDHSPGTTEVTPLDSHIFWSFPKEMAQTIWFSHWNFWFFQANGKHPWSNIFHVFHVDQIQVQDFCFATIKRKTSCEEAQRKTIRFFSNRLPKSAYIHYIGIESRVVKKILSSRRIREDSRHVFLGRAGGERHITIDINSSIQVSSSCQTW